MASQLAIDFSRYRIRALELEGTLKSPRVKSFAAVDVPEAEEGEDPDRVIAQAIVDLLRRHRMVREPAGIALDSNDCTYRDLQLPFDSVDQIAKVIKYEAESHLHLVDIDDVVVSFHPLSSSKSGSRVLVMAYEKEAVFRRLGQLTAAGVDPQFADLHLTGLYAALAQTGYLHAVLEDEEEGDSVALREDPAVLVLECDTDVTHLLVARGQELLGARALRIGTHALHETRPVAPALGPSLVEDDDDEDEHLVLVDDLAGSDHRADHYFSGLRREIQRTLFPLGVSDQISQVFVLGPECADPQFVDGLRAVLDLPVEVGRPFDLLDHRLSEEDLEVANLEGSAALGVALRQLGVDWSAVDFRQEEASYARRFDQVKVPLTWLAMMAFVFVALHGILRLKTLKLRTHDLKLAAQVALNVRSDYTADRELNTKFQTGEISSRDILLAVDEELQERFAELEGSLGRSEAVDPVPSGLHTLRELLAAVQEQEDGIGRLELTSITLKVDSDRPSLRLKGLVTDLSKVDKLITALENCPLVERVDGGKAEEQRDGRYLMNNVDVWLKDLE